MVSQARGGHEVNIGKDAYAPVRSTASDRKDGCAPVRSFGRVGVLMGGPSAEREISLKSGHAVLDALQKAGLDAVEVSITTDERGENERLLKGYSLDCAFIALHGSFGEDGRVQEILEVMNIPYTGSGVDASRLAMDKSESRSLFLSSGIAVPGSVVLTSEQRLKPLPVAARAFVEEAGYPIVVKPAASGSSIGLSIANDDAGLEKAIRTALRFDTRILLEEYVPGRELTVGILGEKALPVIEIIPKNVFFDFEAKYKTGMTEYLVPAPLDADTARFVSETALKAHQALDCRGYSRADIILSGDDLPYVLELNTIPGMTATSLLPKAAAAAGIPFAELCVRLLIYAYQKAGINITG